MIKKKQKIFFLFFICFSIYCALTIGQGWDEETLTNQGKIAVNYLLSLGRIEVDIFRREYYSPIYYSLKFLLIQIFPIKYQNPNYLLPTTTAFFSSLLDYYIQCLKVPNLPLNFPNITKIIKALNLTLFRCN